MAAGAQVNADAHPNSRTVLPDAQRRALRQILRGFERLQIVQASLKRPPPTYQRPRSAWLYYTFRSRSNIQYVRGVWQALVTSGILRDQSRRHGWPRVIGYSFFLVRPDGRRRLETESVLGTAFRGEVATSTARRLREILSKSSAEVGCRLLAVSFSRPLGRLVPEIAVETDDPRAFLRREADNTWTIVAGINRAKPRPLAEGTYLKVQDTRGAWVTYHGYAVRSAAGVSFTNPAFK
jgi:hypothetical protein